MKRLLPLIFATLLFACNGPAPEGPVEPVGPEGERIFATGLNKPEDRAYGVVHWVPKKFAGVHVDSFSWEEKGFETPVRDQKNCGSCWAFADTQKFEMGMKIFGGATIDFSEQDLVGKLFYGCGGGYFAGDYQVRNGQADEASCPYTANNRVCSAPPVAKAPSWGVLGKPNRVPTLDEIQTAIEAYGAISVTVCANRAFMNYRGGLAPTGPKCGTNHMVAITGWKTVNGVVYLKVKNSWGTRWGEGGYGYFERGSYNLAETASYLAVPQVPCQPPALKLPVKYEIKAGDEVILAVKNLPETTYAWYEGSALLGEGPLLTMTPTQDTVYRVIVKNKCGEAEIQTRVVISQR